jgi:hypothetical protein
MSRWRLIDRKDDNVTDEAWIQQVFSRTKPKFAGEYNVFGGKRQKKDEQFVIK